ncbi:hypothetical protein ScPMuIL_009993 [Solemya velum]
MPMSEDSHVTLIHIATAEIKMVQIDDVDAFISWLIKTLAPICDADPTTLARYVLALVKKNRPEVELRETCKEQLEVFLQQKTYTFIDVLFQCLDTKGYLEIPKEEPVPPPPPVVVEAVKIEPLPVAVKVDPVQEQPDRRSESRKRKDEVQSRSPRRARSPRSRSPRYRASDRLRPRSGEMSPGRRRPRSTSPNASKSWSRSRSRSRSRSKSRPRSPTKSKTRSRSGSRSPKSKTALIPKISRSSTPTLDNGLYSSQEPPVPGLEATASVITVVSSSSSGANLNLDKRNVESSAPTDIPPRTKPRCKDYDEKGYCMRGDFCPFDHGLDPVVVEDVAIRNVIPNFPHEPPPPGVPGPPPRPSGPPLPKFMPPAPGMPPLHRPPMNIPPPPLHMGAPPPHAQLPPPPPPPPETYTSEGYNPESPGITTSEGTFWPQRNSSGPYHNPAVRQRDLVKRLESVEEPTVNPPSPERTVVAPRNDYHPSNMNQQRPGYGRGNNYAHRPRGMHYNSPRKEFYRGRGRGGYRRGGMNNTNATLEVKNIPHEMNNIAKINEHFQKFGTLTNIKVCYNDHPDCALISFSHNSEAYAAYSCSEPVFNNRFVKVYWHNAEQKNQNSDSSPGPTSGNEDNRPSIMSRLGQPPPVIPPANKLQLNNTILNRTERPEKSLAYTSSMGSIKRTVFNPGAVRPKTPLTSPTSTKAADIVLQMEAMKKKENVTKEAMKKKVEIQKQKQHLLQREIEEQKLLIERLDKKNMNPEEKAAVMKTLKALTDDIDKLKLELMPKKLTEVPSLKSPEQTKKELLDTELELMTKQHSGEDTTILKKKLSDLTQMAMSLGLLNHSRGRGRGAGRGRAMPFRGSTSLVRTSAGLTPGRGQGVRMMRGRGGFMPGKLTLDNRPRQICITGFDLEEKEDISKHFSKFGEVENIKIDDSGLSAIVGYKSRMEAETAVLHGSKYKDKVLSLQWHIPRTVSLSSDSLTVQAAAGTPDEVSLVEDELDEDILLADDDEEEAEGEERSWRR